MDYRPGQIHESFQKQHYYEMGMDFNIPHYGNVRMVDTETENTLCVEMEKGDVIVIRYFKPNLNSQYAYSFIEGYYRNDNFTPMNVESTISRQFVWVNMQANNLFIDVTDSFIRDRKIKQILDETNENS